MTFDRRDLLKIAGGAFAAGAIPFTAHASASAMSSIAPNFTAHASASAMSSIAPNQQWLTGFLNVHNFGATGDGMTIDTPAINRAIQAAAASGGGTVVVPAGAYACYSIHLKSNVCLYLDQGATILAASVPLEGTASGGYDAAEPQGPWEPYQDYGHNHWHNSLIWGEGISDFAICGPGRIYGKGLSRGHDDDRDLPNTTLPGVGNKSISLKNCRNVILRDFSILRGGWFGILATGVDNLTIDNLKIDTNRDGMDIDCCRNVRITNCTVNSPYDDAIVPKSSFALGYARTTENVTIANCFVTGGYEVGSLLDGTWRVRPQQSGTGRIKCGTESNGGFKNITVTNCVFERCWGIALETADGAVCEDITYSNIAMHDLFEAPFFLSLNARMRGPAGVPIGRIRRVMLNNITSYALRPLPSLISGIAGHPVEDVKISNLYLEQIGGEPPSTAAIVPPEHPHKYPEPTMLGQLPATGIFMRHVRNIEVSSVEVAVRQPDARPAFWLSDVAGADFFRVRVPKGAPAYALTSLKDFRSFGAQFLRDVVLDSATQRVI